MFEQIIDYYRNLFSNADAIFIVGQILGIFLMIFGLFIYVQKKREKILFYKLISDAGSVFQNFMIGAFNGALLLTIAVPRDIVFSQRGRKKWADKIIWLVLFVSLAVLTAFLKWDNNLNSFVFEITAIGLIPAVGSVFSCLGLFSKNTKILKFFSLINALCWTTYSVIVANIGAIISGIIGIVSNIIGLIREIEKPKKDIDVNFY